MWTVDCGWWTRWMVDGRALAEGSFGGADDQRQSLSVRIRKYFVQGLDYGEHPHIKENKEDKEKQKRQASCMHRDNLQSTYAAQSTLYGVEETKKGTVLIPSYYDTRLQLAHEDWPRPEYGVGLWILGRSLWAQENALLWLAGLAS